MRKRTLGAREVSVIGLGGMPLSIDGRPPESQGISVIHAALEAGVTLIDTADVYCQSHVDIGHNERLIAKALAGHSLRKQVLVATKGGLERPDGAWTLNGRPDHLKKACDASLKALGVDAIEVYQLHAPDPEVTYTDTIGALAELKWAGKVQHVGLSNVDVDQIEAARGVVDIVSVQNRCNPFDRDSFENGVVDHCTKEGIAFLPYSPVGGHRGKARTPESTLLNTVAERHGASPFEVCIAWLLAQSEVMFPIPGASRRESIQSSVGAAGIELTAEDLEELALTFPTEPA